MLLNKMRRIDTDDSTFEGRKGEGLGATDGPFIEGTN
jgi:hypothetical protein